MRQNGIRKTDIAVIGGGPAGAAIALELTRGGYSTVIIERSDYRSVRIGETLPPAVKPLLINLGVWDQFVAQKHSPAFGIRSVWGGANLHDNDFIFNAYGAGWHIDRARFDAMLARCAEEAGATVYREACLSSYEINKAGNFEIQINCRDQPRRFLTRFLIDATGRASWFACNQGVKRITLDRLIGVIGFFKPSSLAAQSDSFTLIETVETGWWYSAVLPDACQIVAYMTDADIYADGRKHSTDYWRQQFQATKHTRTRVRPDAQATDLLFVPANSSRLDRIGQGNWLAIGDAAMAFDPLSGQGVYNALRSANRAAEAIDQHLTGNPSALPDYSVAAEQDFDGYLSTRRNFYCREQRWPSSTFWQRRIADQITAEPFAQSAVRT